MQPQVLIPSAPQVVQPVIQPAPQVVQPVIQPAPQFVQPVIQPAPQVAQPVIQTSAPVMVQPQQVSGYNLYPMNQCPQHCYGLRNWSGQSGCLPTQQWPFIRCGYGGSYSGGIGGYGDLSGYIGQGGYGGYGGLGGYIGQNGYGGYSAGVQPIAG